jgi:hypothetical protein
MRRYRSWDDVYNLLMLLKDLGLKSCGEHKKAMTESICEYINRMTDEQ